MDKQLYYERLHQELAKIYNITPYGVSFIRINTSKGLSRKEIAMFLVDIMHRPRFGYIPEGKKNRVHLRRRSKAEYQKLLSFVVGCSDAAWNDIIRPTQYDLKLPLIVKPLLLK